MSVILVVEDVVLVRKPIEIVLRNAGYTTIAASNGEEALAAFERSRADLILLDVTMPVLDGISFLHTLRALPHGVDVPVIMLTAVSEKAKIVETVKLGISGYLLKPRLSASDLLKQIRKVLGHSAPTVNATQGLATPTPKQDSLGIHGPDIQHQATSSMLPSTAAPVSGARVLAAPLLLNPTASAQSNLSEHPSEALRSLKPILSRSELTAKIDKCGELKGFSAAVGEVLKLTGNARCSINEVSRAISHDHAIALKILKMANSAVYTRGEPVDSVHQAVLRIGLSQIRQVVLNIAVIERFEGQGVHGHIHSGQFWEHAIATGIIAAEIAHCRDPREADPAFTMGLLHDVGRLVYAAELGDQFVRVLDTAATLQLPLEQVEQRMLCYNHADVMDRVFRAWKFSKQLINPIVFHHLSADTIRSAAPQEAVQVATLGLANRLAHAFMLGSSGNQAVYPTDELCELLRLDAKVMARIEATIRDQTTNMKFSLLGNSNMANWPQLSLETKRHLLQPLRPLFVDIAPEFDAHRIFVEQLTEPSTNPADSNVGIIYIRHARDRALVSDRYKSLEDAAGVSKLPLLVISHSGKLEPETSLLSDRRVQRIATPFTISRFVNTINGLLATRKLQAA